MVRKIKLEINFSNKWLYTLIAIGILAIITAGVYAFTGNVGHTSDQIDEVDPTVIASVKDGISWTEISNRPAGLDDGDDVGGACPSGTLYYYDNGGDTYHSFYGRYSSPPQADTCNGDVSNPYTCQKTESRNCMDIDYYSSYYHPRQIECRINLDVQCRG